MMIILTLDLVMGLVLLVFPMNKGQEGCELKKNPASSGAVTLINLLKRWIEGIICMYSLSCITEDIMLELKLEYIWEIYYNIHVGLEP